MPTLTKCDYAFLGFREPLKLILGKLGSFRVEIERADALRHAVFAGTITRVPALKYYVST
jgi:hypothetical protein